MGYILYKFGQNGTTVGLRAWHSVLKSIILQTNMVNVDFGMGGVK